MDLTRISKRSVLAHIVQERLSLPPGRIKTDKKADSQLTQIVDSQIKIAKNIKSKLAPAAFKFLMEAAFPDFHQKPPVVKDPFNDETENIESAIVELVLSE